MHYKEETVQRLYREIGRQYYDLHKNDEEPLCEEVELITEMLGELLEMKKAVAQFKGKRVCPDCGAPNDDDALFCKKCGARCEDEDAGSMEEADAEIVAEMEKAEEADAQIVADREKAKKVDVEIEDIEDYKG